MLKSESLGEGIYSFFNENVAHSRCNPTFKLKLTPEQEKKLQEDPKKEIYSIDFFHPKQTISYFCDECKNTFQEEPNIEAYIRLETISKNEPQAVANILYKCKNCDKTFYIGTVIDKDNTDKIPLEFIKYDETGDYKKPTKESIEELLSKIESNAKDCSLDMQAIRVCRRWAEKINYALDEERIKKLDSIFNEACLKRFEKNLPDLVEEIRKESYQFNLGRCTADSYGSMYSNSGLANHVDKLLENIFQINLPEDNKLREDILKILFQYRKMHDNDIESAIHEKAETEKKFNKRIQSCQDASIEATQMISQYCEKAGINKETIDKIADETTIPFPGDEIEF